MSTEESQCCQNCGDEIPSEEDAVYGGRGIKAEGAERLANGETVGASELIVFDDGPYCSLGCSIGEDGESA